MRIAATLLIAACTASLGAAGARAAPALSRDTFVETAPGVRIHVTVAGEPSSRPPLVLIPGWRLTASVWREQIEAFSRERQVIALDPRSQGESSKTPDGDTPETRAQDLHAVLAALGARKVVLTGWSQGVQDVAAFVQQFGVDGLAGIVLVDSTVSRGSAAAADPASGATGELRQMALYMRYPREATEGMMRAIIRRPLSPAELDTLVSNALKTPTAIGAAMLADDLLGPDRTPALAKMIVPTLVVASASSPELDGQKAMAAKLPHGRFEAISGAGHAVFVDQPEQFDALLRTFIAGLDQSASDRR